MLLVAASGLAVLTRRSDADARAFDRARPVQATVLSAVSAGGGRGGGAKTRVEVRYDVAGEAHTTSVLFEQALRADVVGGPITVLVDPEDPDRAFDPADSPDDQLEVAAALAALGLVAGAVALRTQRRARAIVG